MVQYILEKTYEYDNIRFFRISGTSMTISQRCIDFLKIQTFFGFLDTDYWISDIWSETRSKTNNLGHYKKLKSKLLEAKRSIFNLLRRSDHVQLVHCYATLKETKKPIHFNIDDRLTF